VRFKVFTGGGDMPDNPNECPKCESTNCQVTSRADKDDPYDMRRCNSCGNEWLTYVG
jgi:hypothetical protein